MFCGNCGYEMDPNAVVCVKCGCAKGTGTAYCRNCGGSVTPDAAVCLQCGAGVRVGSSGGKSRVVAGIMGILFGCFGVHNFILGYHGKAVAQLLITLLSFFLLYPISAVWGLVEGILILTGTIDADAADVPLAD